MVSEKSEMSIIWCISITNNVKSNKKFNETAQTANFTDFPLILCGNGPKYQNYANANAFFSNWKKILGDPGYAIGKLTSRAFWKCDRFLWYHILNQAKIGNKIPKILLLNQKKTPFRAKIPNLEPKYHQYNFWTKNFPFKDEKTEIWDNFQTFWVLGFRSFRVRGFRMFGVHF